MTATTDSSLQITGRTWIFGDEVNTDDMYPGSAMRLPTADAAKLMFSATRPGWPSLVRPGDIVVAGRNFGLGSSRPVPELFQELGIGALVAEHFNSLFYRNCINYGLAALTVPDVRRYVSEGDEVSLDVGHGRLLNTTTGTDHQAIPLPEFLLSILRAGGLIAQLEVAGLLQTTSPTDRRAP